MLRTPEELEEYIPGFLAFIDSTEQQIPRPIDKNRRKTFYSGKKKKHAVKTQLMVNNHGFIIHKLRHKKGRNILWAQGGLSRVGKWVQLLIGITDYF